MNVFEKVLALLKDAPAAVAAGEAVVADLEAGKMPDLTAAQLAALGKFFVDVKDILGSV